MRFRKLSAVLLAHLKAMIGYFPAMIGHSDVMIGDSRAVIGHFPMMISDSPATIGHSKVIAGNSGADQTRARLAGGIFRSAASRAVWPVSRPLGIAPKETSEFVLWTFRFPCESFPGAVGGRTSSCPGPMTDRIFGPRHPGGARPLENPRFHAPHHPAPRPSRRHRPRAEAARYLGAGRSGEPGRITKDPVVFTVASGGGIIGAIYSNVYGRRIPVRGRVRQDGTFRLRAGNGGGVSGFLAGKVRHRQLRARGRLQCEGKSDYHIQIAARVPKAHVQRPQGPTINYYLLRDLSWRDDTPEGLNGYGVGFSSKAYDLQIVHYSAQVVFHRSRLNESGGVVNFGTNLNAEVYLLPDDDPTVINFPPTLSYLSSVDYDHLDERTNEIQWITVSVRVRDTDDTDYENVPAEVNISLSKAVPELGGKDFKRWTTAQRWFRPY